MNLFSKVSSFVLVTGLVVSSLASVSTFAVSAAPFADSINQTQNAKEKLKEAKQNLKTAKTDAKKAVKAAKTEVKKAKISHRLQKSEVIYKSLLKRADAKGIDTTKIKANIETLKTSELKLKTDLDASATSDILKADRAAIKTALAAVRADAKDLRAQLVAKK
jgi:IS5 family transposase